MYLMIALFPCLPCINYLTETIKLQEKIGKTCSFTNCLSSTPKKNKNKNKTKQESIYHSRKIADKKKIIVQKAFQKTFSGIQILISHYELFSAHFSVKVVITEFFLNITTKIESFIETT